MAKFFGGSDGEPSKEKPVVVHSARNGNTEVSVRKVFDSTHEEKVKKLAEESMKLKVETADLLKKMAAEIKGENNG